MDRILESYDDFLNEAKKRKSMAGSRESTWDEKKEPKQVPYATYARYLGISDEDAKKIWKLYGDREDKSLSDHQMKMMVTKMIGSALNSKLYKWFQYDGYLPDNLYKAEESYNESHDSEINEAGRGSKKDVQFTEREIFAVIKEFNSNKIDLAEFYNKILWYLGEPDTTKNVEKLKPIIEKYMKFDLDKKLVQDLTNQF